MKALQCNRCKNIWRYKGANPYCTNCSRCKSTVFIKKSSVLTLNKNGVGDDLIEEKSKVIDNGPSVQTSEDNIIDVSTNPMLLEQVKGSYSQKQENFNSIIHTETDYRNYLMKLNIIPAERFMTLGQQAQ